MLKKNRSPVFPESGWFLFRIYIPISFRPSKPDSKMKYQYYIMNAHFKYSVRKNTRFD